MLRPSTIFAAVALCCASQSGAQLGLPGGLPQLPNVGTIANPVLTPVNGLLSGPLGEVSNTLRLARLDRIETLVRDNRATIERDREGAPARRGVLLLIDPDAATLASVSALGFVAGTSAPIEGLDLSVSQVTLPNRMSLSDAQKLLKKKVPGATVSSDQIFFQSGGIGASANSPPRSHGETIRTPIGLIDGSPAQDVTATKGFAKGAPVPSNHGSAVAALAYAAGARSILVADVYGTDPAGGNALAIAQGMGWLIGRGAKVISISLVGPRSPLLERAVASAQARGAVIVAAVGNDGPASPPAFPASYNGVLAITAVDKRNRPLIEAGHALHLDYAAPGADIAALDRSGRLAPVRGTSFAVPLVATRVGAALDRGVSPRAMVGVLDAEAQQISRRRPDPQSGRGLLCGTCR
jgi:hypothetical protein